MGISSFDPQKGQRTAMALLGLIATIDKSNHLRRIWNTPTGGSGLSDHSMDPAASWALHF
jgi:hypothetical protein